MSSQYESAAQALHDKVRLVQDFPEEGILFEDLTPVLLQEGDIFSRANDNRVGHHTGTAKSAAAA